MKLKKTLAALLAAALMCGLLCVPAMAAPITAHGGDYVGVNLSDGTKEGEITYVGYDDWTYTKELYHVPVGVTVALDPMVLDIANIYTSRIEETGGKLKVVDATNKPEFVNGAATFGAGTEGYWLISAGSVFIDVFVIKVGGTAPSTPAEPENPTTPAQPEKPTDPQPTGNLAKAGDQDIEIDGTKVAFQTYMLADADGNGTNYVKLRDIAHVLNGTGAQFSVGYNRQQQSISATTGKAYKDTGTEMDTPFAGADKEFVQSQMTIVIDGTAVQLDAITLVDDAGNGYNYFQLRDLGKALGFNVGYSRARGVYVETK